ncbi:MAG: hypothetical protein HY300_10920 [Verrucomicrobia bacterium]|nr:hypothetical protein [Verrucomicrobiota bacterium]
MAASLKARPRPAEPPTVPAAAHAVLPQWLEGGVAVLDRAGCIADINDSFATWLGAMPDTLAGHPFWDLLTERCADWRAPLEEARVSPQTFTSARLGLVQEGSARWFHLELARSSTGCFVRLHSVLPPMAELSQGAWDEHLAGEDARRDMFMRLLRAEAQLDSLIHHWPGVIFSQRADLSFQFASPKIEEFTGVPVSEWQRQPHRFWQVLHEGDVLEIKQHLRHTSQTPEGTMCTFRIRHARTGRVTHILEHRRAVRSASGLLLSYEGAWLDVTRQAIAEKRLSTVAWKEALGAVTMGLAHDFSNLLTSVHSLAEALIGQVEAGHPFEESLALIRTNSLQAAQLVRRIMGLHHGKTGERSYHDLNAIVADVSDLVCKMLPRRVQVNVAPATGEIPLYVDAFEFQQVILNLALNAADAMPQSGQLEFCTSVHTQLPDMPNCHGVRPHAPAACLSVHDTGAGIPPRLISSIFDPFFTTKPLNKGSGLGLYNARLFVEKHHGAISVESAEGRGTTFHVWLPVSDFTEAERAQRAAGASRQSLLLAGPNGRAVESTAEFLREHGYRVAVALLREEVLQLLDSPESNFTAVMLLAGRREGPLDTLFQELDRRNAPLKRVLQVTGCDHDEVDAQLLRLANLVISPDTPTPELLERLDTLLAGASKS